MLGAIARSDTVPVKSKFSRALGDFAADAELCKFNRSEQPAGEIRLPEICDATLLHHKLWQSARIYDQRDLAGVNSYSALTL